MPAQLPSLESVHKEVLTWDFYDIETTEGKAGSKTLSIRKVPQKFASVDEYIEIFEPLLIEECKSQVVRAKEESDTTVQLELLHAEKVNDFVYVRFAFERTANLRFAPNDLILVTKDEPTKRQSVHALGLVEMDAASALEVRFFLRDHDLRSRAFAAHLVPQSRWHISKLHNLVTINREYQALHSSRELQLLSSVLNPSSAVSSASAPLHIPVLMYHQLQQQYNSSQLDAMQAALKRKGFTLIQGPPGTGKTKTILGLLSVLLNSTTAKNISDLDKRTEREGQHGATSDSASGGSESDSDSDVQGKAGLPERRAQVRARFSKSMPWLSPRYCAERPQYIRHPYDRNHDAYPTAVQQDSLITLCMGGKVEKPRHILVSAPSNAAIDEICIRLLQVGLYNSDGHLYIPKVVRVGPNYHPSLRNIALDVLVEEKLAAGGPLTSDQLRLQILDDHNIVATTLSGSGASMFAQMSSSFDTVVIDEAGQAVEISTLIPLKYGCTRCIMVGDPNQLPATVFSRLAASFMYERSLFKRFQENNYKVWMLRIQYRMHPEISQFPSRMFYHGQLEDGPNMAELTAQPFHQYKVFSPYVLFDVTSKERLGVTSSYHNKEEAFFCTLIFRNLMAIYPDPNLPCRVGVVTPYKQQVKELRRRFAIVLGPEQAQLLDINTVDGFQGREKDIIMFSCVRSHPKKSIGFLSDIRRMNVGITRARQSLFIVGNALSLSLNEQWGQLVQDAKQRGAYIRVSKPVNTFFSRMFAQQPGGCRVLPVDASEEEVSNLAFDDPAESQRGPLALLREQVDDGGASAPPDVTADAAGGGGGGVDGPEGVGGDMDDVMADEDGDIF